MEFRIKGTITFLRKIKVSAIRSRKNPATMKNPAAVLSTSVPTHKANPVKRKTIKKKTKIKLTMPIAAPAAALEAPLVTLALARSLYVFTYSVT